MHEMALCQSVVDALRQQAARHGFARVTTVRLEIGALACVSAEAIEFSFHVISRGTLADGARLELIRVPGEAACLECGASSLIAERYDPCPACGGHHLRLIQGDEMRIRDLEVC